MHEGSDLLGLNSAIPTLFFDRIWNKKMESDPGKLFVGGISWDADENRLKEYFGTYGEVVESVIMRDRVTGRARGFGFVIFADHAVAERVVMEKHVIDGRTVEAKKAVPRDEHHILSRNNSSIQVSQSPGRTKKIFVGGLASTVTESDFKLYFDQFGIITDIVVMYDQNTQRPRGFGFITYDSEDAVDWVLHKTFHELNGKMVEVKRAVPKELSPVPSQSPLVGYNYCLSRTNNFRNSYAQGYNMSSGGSYGVRMMDGSFNPIASNRSAFSPFGSLGYGADMNLETRLSLSYGGNSNFSNNLGYGRVLSPYYSSNSNRYTTPIGNGGANFRNESLLSSPTQNVWGNAGFNNAATTGSPREYLGAGGGNFRVFGNSRANWGSSPISPQGGGSASGHTGGAIGYSGVENNNGLRGGGIGRNGGTSVAAASLFAASGGGYEPFYGDLYRGGSVYGDSTWQSAASEIDGSGSFGYGMSSGADVSAKGSEGYVGSYGIANRKENRGIAA